VTEPAQTNTLDTAIGDDGFLHHPHLFLVLEGHRPLAPSVRWSLAGVQECLIRRGDKRFSRFHWKDANHHLEVLVPDGGMSGEKHARLARVGESWTIEDQGSKNGVRVNGAAHQRIELSDGDIIEVGQTFFLFRSLLAVRTQDPPEIDAAHIEVPAHGLATLIPQLADSMERLVQVARSDVSIILGGESGTGKEVAARAVHTLSGRKGPFLAVNCAAIAGNIVESEFFGYRRGAFSGADEDRQGLIRASDGGTLFLDEIGDLPLGVQVKLLRVLQEHEVLPLGGTQPVRVDIRILAATHHRLDSLVQGGQFRSDLLARLNSFHMELPPLRERREDLGIIIASLLRMRAPNRTDIALDLHAARALMYYPWPLNVRELEQCLTTALVLATKRPIKASDFPPVVRAAAELPATPKAAPVNPEREDAERRELMVSLLRQHEGNVAAIARAMGTDPKQIRRWLKKYKLS
jgi:DNA-binding NtrC family response regulator